MPRGRPQSIQPFRWDDIELAVVVEADSGLRYVAPRGRGIASTAKFNPMRWPRFGKRKEAPCSTPRRLRLHGDVAGSARGRGGRCGEPAILRQWRFSIRSRSSRSAWWIPNNPPVSWWGRITGQAVRGLGRDNPEIGPFGRSVAFPNPPPVLSTLDWLRTMAERHRIVHQFIRIRRRLVGLVPISTATWKATSADGADRANRRAARLSAAHPPGWPSPGGDANRARCHDDVADFARKTSGRGHSEWSERFCAPTVPSTSSRASRRLSARTTAA